MIVRFMFLFVAVFVLFAHMGSPAIFGDSVTSCHMVASSPEQVYLSFLSSDSSHVTVYQTIWTRHGRHLLECSMEDEQSLVTVYQSFCEASLGNSTKHPFSVSQDFEDLQAEPAYQILRESCPVLAHQPSPGLLDRSKREAPKRHLQGAASLPGVQQELDAEATVAPSLEGEARRRVKRGWTIPGTLWCGAGNSAGNFTDLGIFQGTDLCCREHDRCTEVLTAWEFKYGIRNYRVHTISHCDCDYRFKLCLYNLNDTISTFVGITYFNLLEMPCFMMEERESCLNWLWWGGCKEYGPTSLAVIQKQGHYNYTHPFTDELDERYKLNAAMAHNTFSTARSAGLNTLPPRHTKQESPKLQRRPVKENQTNTGGVHSVVPMLGKEAAIARTVSNQVDLKGLMVPPQVLSSWAEAVEERKSKYVSNYVAVQKFVSLEALNSKTNQSYLPNLTASMDHRISDLNTAQNSTSDHTGMVIASTDQASVALSTTDQSSFVQLSTGQVRMNVPITDQNSMSHLSTNQPSVALPLTDQTELVHPGTYWTHLVQSMKGQASAGQTTITDNPGSEVSNTDQPIMSQPTKPLITDTLQPSHGQPSMTWSSADTMTILRMDTSSSEGRRLDMFMNKTVKEIQETNPVTGDILAEKTSTQHILNYVDDYTRVHDSHSKAIASTQDLGGPTKGRTVTGAAASEPLEEDPILNQENVYLKKYTHLLQVAPKMVSPHSNVPQDPAVYDLPNESKSSHHYVSKNCGCYRRLDQCKYKIAPKEENFQLHNLDVRTLYHCNCTRRLARFLLKKKRPNEVQEVLSDFVSPSCFVLESRKSCSEGKSCHSVSTAILGPAGHLKRTLKFIQKNSRSWTPMGRRHMVEESVTMEQAGALLKVKRQDLKRPSTTPEPVKLYEQCLQRVRRLKANMQTWLL